MKRILRYADFLFIGFRTEPGGSAKTLAPMTPEQLAHQGAKIADEARRDLVSWSLSFCMETVFSEPVGEKVQFLKDTQTAGYMVVGLLIRLAPLSNARVAQQVSRGGHDVPDATLASCFECTAKNIHAAM